MGRLNVSYVIRNLTRAFTRLLPYKYRRPFILIFSILGLIAYFNFACYFSKTLTGVENQYLNTLGNVFIGLKQSLETNISKQTLYMILGTMFLILLYKYCIKDIFDDEDNNYKSKSNKSRSWYTRINGYISFGYFVITILMVIPIVTKYIGG